MPDSSTIDVIDIPFYSKPLDRAVGEVIRDCSGPRKNRCVSATGAHGVVHARKNPQFGDMLRSYHINLPDGVPCVWVGRMKGASEMERCYGPDFFASVIQSSAGEQIRHFLCGGADGVAEELAAACSEKFGNSNISGTYSPPFLPVDSYDYEEIARQINQSGADIVWIGLGAPKQEEFAGRLARHTDVHFLITVGAAFDFHTGRVPQAPRWMQRSGLEWFYRLSKEPGRLWKRYVEIVPKFIVYAAGDLIRSRSGKPEGDD